MEKIIVSEYDDFCVFRENGQLFFENFDYEEGNADRITPIEVVLTVPYGTHIMLEEDELLDRCDDYDVSYEEDIGGNYIFAKYIEEE